MTILILVTGCATEPDYPSISICPTCVDTDCRRPNGLEGERIISYTCKMMGTNCKCKECGCCK